MPPKRRTDTSERRRTPRVSERVPLGITEGGTTLEAETVNLSAAGAYCTLDRFLAPMTKLQLDYGTGRRASPRSTTHLLQD